jgi:hypothetical protein
MISPSNFFRVAIGSTLISILLFGCASSNDSSSVTNEAQEIQAQVLGDMPLPAGSKILSADSLIIGRGDNWVGRAVLSGAQNSSDIYAFFQAEFPKAGWTTVSAVKAKTGILVFSKADRTATVEINDGSFTGPKSMIAITASPKNANVLVPGKR